MNVVNLLGRPTRDPEVSFSNETAIAKLTLAVDNPFRKDQDADFIRIVAFGKTAEFVENYITKGKRIAVTGRLQSGSYENDKGDTVYTTDVVVSNIYFADSAQPQDTPKEAPKGKQGQTKGKNYSRR